MPDRLAEFYRRLAAAPAATSANEALKLIALMLKEVEDEMSGISDQIPNPPPTEFDGRMYPPHEDHLVRYLDGSLTATVRRHIIEITSQGDIIIRHLITGEVEFSKTGAARHG